jgi:hypothetical protein
MNEVPSSDSFSCQGRLLKFVASNRPFVSRTAPIHLGCKQRGVDTILIPHGDIDEGTDERI